MIDKSKIPHAMRDLPWIDVDEADLCLDLYDGDVALVAVNFSSAQLYEFDVVTSRVDEDESWFECNDAPWSFSPEDIELYLKLEK